MMVRTEFNKNGFIHIQNIIPRNDLLLVRQICEQLKITILNDDLLGKPKNFGAPVFSRSLDMSSKLDATLATLCRSSWLIDMAKNLLGQNEIYLFNDQVVVKLPNEDFAFPEHTDNWFGPNPEGALLGEFSTITCCWVLDDFTNDNGPIQILNKHTHDWHTPLAKAGDLLIWDGNTPHKSDINISNSARCAWLQIYSTHDVGGMKNVNKSDFVSPVDFSRFHSIKF